MTTKNHPTRREFIKQSTGAAIALSLPIIVPARVFGANDRINVAVLGVNGRGRNHIKGFEDLDNVEVTCLCDPDNVILQQRAGEFEETYGRKVKTEMDLRKVYEDKDIDAVSIATPNHWHALATIWACQAGKDVYVEIPEAVCGIEGGVEECLARLGYGGLNG